jgi:hypothetical protein
MFCRSIFECFRRISPRIPTPQTSLLRRPAYPCPFRSLLPTSLTLSSAIPLPLQHLPGSHQPLGPFSVLATHHSSLATTSLSPLFPPLTRSLDLSSFITCSCANRGRGVHRLWLTSDSRFLVSDVSVTPLYPTHTDGSQITMIRINTYENGGGGGSTRKLRDRQSSTIPQS